MKNVLEHAKEKSKMNEKGQTINLISGTVVGFMVLIFIVFAVLFGISALNPGSFFTTDANGLNNSQDAVNELQDNLTSGISEFADNIPTVLTVLGVVLALSGIVILIVFVRRMQGTAGGGGSL